MHVPDPDALSDDQWASTVGEMLWMLEKTKMNVR